ncbi:hypothetical protein M4A92_17705, partial [Caldibacillus thermoamylovorans]|uniref:hypothetical protein n=1 Tax=Caldibacillus thermoamylovorans TaxID=35841 RepID=UPI00203F49E9
FLEKNSHFIFIKFKNLEEKAKNEIINFPEPRSRVYFLFWQRLSIICGVFFIRLRFNILFIAW